jgi:hypothetical protein
METIYKYRDVNKDNFIDILKKMRFIYPMSECCTSSISCTIAKPR